MEIIKRFTLSDMIRAPTQKGGHSKPPTEVKDSSKSILVNRTLARDLKPCRSQPGALNPKFLYHAFRLWLPSVSVGGRRNMKAGRRDVGPD
ncbi:uncharacterized protein G2W53_017935 [Senna tora]|uniref:Uncharacterized protein n=1 Tax=Senna tora TaxID=362788 RepID=A0A834TU63_9FABA|nr:uncharacterized protein G2W53_017935 [Senna tora]